MTVDAIFDFWFGSDHDDSVVAKEKSALWWSKNSEIDGEIRQRFENLVIRAAEDELSDWQANPRGRLALILVTDQFPRNIFRDSAKAFAYDSKPLGWSLDGIQEGLDLKLRPIERVFFYLPLEHSESLQHQEQSVKYFGELFSTVRPENKPIFEEYLNFAVRHRDIIARFGNKILGRESTADELAFLAGPGSSF